MERRIDTADGRVLRIRVPGAPEPVAEESDDESSGTDPAFDDDVFVDEDGYDGSGEPGAPHRDDVDHDGFDEGATQALVLVDPKPNAMLVEGAVAAVGVMARHLAGSREVPEPQGWWRDWGMYVIPLALVLIGAMALQLLV